MKATHHLTLVPQPREVAHTVDLLNPKNTPTDLEEWQLKLVANPKWAVWLIGWAGETAPDCTLRASGKHFEISCEQLFFGKTRIIDNQGDRTVDGTFLAYDVKLKTRNTVVSAYRLTGVGEEQNRILVFYYHPTILRRLKYLMLNFFPNT
jgi:hypothetical protein